MLADLVSIIILNYNGSHLLPECLDAVLRQTYPNCDVIVVDNGSKDGSGALVRARFPDVRLQELGENLGFCGGNNRGMSIARGKYIALLNNDAVPEPQWLENLVRALEEDPSAGFCASKMIVYGSGGILDSAGDGWATVGSAIKLRSGEMDGPDHSTPRYVFSACAGAALYRRSMIDDIGGFDEDFFFSWEDVDLGFRAQLAGYKCLLVPKAVVHHRVGASSSNQHMRAFFTHRNMEFVYFKNMPGSLFWKYFVPHALFTLGVFVKEVSRGRGVAFLRGKLDFLLNLGGVLRKRLNIQRKKNVSSEYMEAVMQSGFLLFRLREQFQSRVPLGTRK